MSNNLIDVKSNVFCIPERLREIDKGYYVVFNTISQCFEVHHREQIGNTLALNIPYGELDCRTVDLVRNTRIENGRKFIEDMDRHNERLELEKEKRLLEYIDVTGREIHKYCSGKAFTDIIPDDAYTSRFI